MKKFWLLFSFLLFSLFLRAQVPSSAHVVVVLEENHGYSSVIGNSAMPYLNSLASQNALATQYFANTHPSIGNYFMLTTGQIITNDDGFSGTVNTDNIVRHLLTAGKTWKSYAEGLPSVGYTGGDSGAYLRHHNPFSYFSDVVNSSAERLNLVPFTQFARDLNNGQLPDFSFVVPDVNNDAHNGSLQQADQWLRANIAPLLNNAGFQRDGILMIVFDEASTSDTAWGGGHVVAVLAGPHVKKGFQSTTHYQHQNLLRTIMAAIGTGSYPGAAAGAPPMSDAFGGNTPPPPPPPGSCTASTIGVTVCAPASGSTDASPVQFVASAKSSAPITAMRIYVDNVSKYLTFSGSLNTSLALSSGTHFVVVQAWDSTGAVFKNSRTIGVK
ncbi:MAG TPA: alkaline phosphatase family protein [Candidatus Angelobacter sp.]